MKARHEHAYRLHSIAILQQCRIPIGADFHTLTSAQVESLLDAANDAKYRRPAHANGSRARYFHDLLQRRAGS